MDNDYSSERLEYQSGQRNEKRAAGRIYPPAEKPDRTGVGADRRGGVRHSRHVLLGDLREVLSMRILGIDPGYATTGFGILQAERTSVQLINYGTITTPTTLSFPERLEMLYDDMAELLDTVRPDAVAVEELFWGHNVTTGIGVSHGRGVILLAICKAHTPLFEYTPNQVKQAVVGYGSADKHQVMEMTRRILHMEKVARPDDAADAIAIALCHARSSTSLLAQKGIR